MKTWVLVIAETNPKKRLWKNAVPALISGVTHCHSISNSQPDTRVNVLIPNLFGLRYGFTGPRYAELRDLKLSDIRVYTGTDCTKLKDALVKAVQEVARKRSSEQKDDTEETIEGSALRLGLGRANPEELRLNSCQLAETTFQDNSSAILPETMLQAPTTHTLEDACAPALSSLSSPLRECSASRPERDTTQENIDALFNDPPSSQPCFTPDKRTQSSQSSERHTTRANIAALFNGGGAVISEHSETTKTHQEEVAPTTPLASQRNLMRHDTPIDAEFQVLSRPVSQSKQYARVDQAIALSKASLSEITSAVAKAFRDAKEDILSKQSLEIAVTKATLGISPEIFTEALAQLHAMNKVMLTDDLVFKVS